MADTTGTPQAEGSQPTPAAPAHLAAPHALTVEADAKEDTTAAGAAAAAGAVTPALCVTRREPMHVPEAQAWDPELFSIPHHYKKYVLSVMLPYGMIRDRVHKVAADIRSDYGHRTPHLLCVLKGAAEFFAELSNALKAFHEATPQLRAPYTFDFVRVKSYRNDQSTGNVQIIGGDLDALRGRDVIIVEDIIDSGLTMTKLVPHVLSLGASTVKVASLLEKRTDRSCGFKGDYVGFSIPDKFIIGYNMDYNEGFRDLRHLCVINEMGKEHFREPAAL